jgi:hypothetical protein
VKTLKSGPFFDECLRFPDGKRHKFAHALCAYDAGLRLEELGMEFCTLDGCNRNFVCERNSQNRDEEGCYLPGEAAEWGCEPEGCLYVERGYFRSMKGGKFLKFVCEQRGAVHWACARGIWKWEILKGMAGSFSKELIHASAA